MYSYKKERLNDKLFPLQNEGTAVSRISCHILRYGSCSKPLRTWACLSSFVIPSVMDILVPHKFFAYYYYYYYFMNFWDK
ncbi:hypothetical protein RIF29_42409 [Crotalaria pallida]|uniref:Uncharacterized protein n=1 Tax=Crotalaria pallida TaxID=3830 RepID=A0AAN9ECI6_CROPI